MRLTARFSTALLGLALAAALPATAAAQRVAAVLSDVTGTVMVGGVPAQDNSKVFVDSTVTTAANSSCVIIFLNGTTTVSLEADSSMKVERFNTTKRLPAGVPFANLSGEPGISNVRLNVAYGEGVVDVSDKAEASTVDIVTPVGTAGVRGTRVPFSFPRGGGAGGVGAVGGRFQFFPASGAPFDVGDGQETDGRGTASLRARLRELAGLGLSKITGGRSRTFTPGGTEPGTGPTLDDVRDTQDLKKEAVNPTEGAGSTGGSIDG